jgi:hypothetical protein
MCVSLDFFRDLYGKLFLLLQEQESAASLGARTGNKTWGWSKQLVNFC